MSILETVKQRRATRLQERRALAIGADLIPRAPGDDPRYAGVALAARGVDVDVLRTGIARLDVTAGDLPPDLLAIAERIAGELQTAGPDDIGRYATDVLYAYGDVPNLSPAVEAAMFHAWALSIMYDTGHNKSETKPIQKRYTTESEAA